MDSKAYSLQSPSLGGLNIPPVKMNSKGEIRTPKPPKAPEKPLMPYMRYSRKVWEQVKNSNPHLKLWEVGKIIGQMWRELPDDEKTLYVEEYDIDKTQYTEALRQYHSSPAYQAWLVAKERAEKMMEEQDQERKQSISRSRDRTDLLQADLRESYMLEDNEEDTEDQYTAKHVAAARFQRNHRLMQEILSDTRLPDPGQLITQSRLNTLRLQVEQLKNHKRNLCQEIEGCETRQHSRLERIQQDSNKFVADYEKLTSTRPMITESQFMDMIVKAKHDLQREEGERIQRYLAEVELRRRKQQQQQQRQQLEEAERRRQQQQPIESIPPPTTTPQSTTASSIQQEPKPESVPLPSTSVGQTVKPPIPVEEPAETHVSAATSIPGHFSQSSASLGMKHLHPGHTQHHYAPASPYPPGSVPSVEMMQRTGLSPMSQESLGAQALLRSPNPVAAKRNYPSPSPIPAASTFGVKKNKSDNMKDHKNADGLQPSGNFEGCPVSSDTTEQSRPPEQLMPNHPVDVVRPPAARHQTHVMPPSGGLPGQPPSQYGHQTNALPHGMPAPGFYHSGPLPQPSMHQPGFSTHPGRPQFAHGPTGVYGPGGQYPPQHPPMSEHAPPPPMYIQHIPQHQQPTHPIQQGPGHVIGSQTHIPIHPHQSSGWHQVPAPGYPTSTYGMPRYPSGYGAPPTRHMSASGYEIPHPTMHQPMHQQQQANPTHTSEAMHQGGAQQQQIPAPPPYQQQPQQQNTCPPGYWTASPHSMPPEYCGPAQPPTYVQQPPEQQPHHASMMEGSTSGSGHSEAVAGTHMNAPQQPHPMAMYYPGYQHSTMQGSYGPPPGSMPPGGFYGLPPGGGQYAPHAQPQGGWANYPQQMGSHPPPQPYPSAAAAAATQPHHQPHPYSHVGASAAAAPTPKSDAPSGPGSVGVTSMEPPQVTRVNTPIGGGPTSRPPSASSQGQN